MSEAERTAAGTAAGHDDLGAANHSPLRVAVIGAGPAGFYAAEALLKGREDVSVDLIDRLPTPYGLVRFGVAPDHQKLKSVTRLYERTLGDARLRYLGNVEFGRHLTADDLRRHYHAAVYAVGSPADRRLGIPGEDLPGSLSATEFVAWYNGHPDYQDLQVPLGATTAVVIGVGNVAIDVTRVLAKSNEELAQTDMADHAVEHLKGSSVEEVIIVGRRGPAEAKFTTKELRELGELLNADIFVDQADLVVPDASRAAIANDVNAQKNLEVLEGFVNQAPTGKPRRVRIRFLLSPVEIQGDGRVERVVFERNRLEERGAGRVAALPTGELETVEAQLVFRSVGYRGAPLPGVPFDDVACVIPNEGGRVLHEGQPLRGAYVAGWIKRGPSGVIGTNKADAMESVAALLEDAAAGRLAEPPEPSTAALDGLLAERGADPFDASEWLGLDAVELAAGAAQGRPRVKVVGVDAMLRAGRARASEERGE
ncbi:MAG: FAD-dependent oxidoreductase [Trueperaceae bacterium]